MVTGDYQDFLKKEYDKRKTMKDIHLTQKDHKKLIAYEPKDSMVPFFKRAKKIKKDYGNN